MEWLNYHHLLYFWTVAREGGVTAASKVLNVAQPTISAQVRTLESSLGEDLFVRTGRGLELTEVGQVAFRYADGIFSLGRELMDTVKGRPTSRWRELRVGLSDIVPKLVAYRLLEPALRMDPPFRLVCKEDKTERLLAELSIHGVDMVLCDEPLAGTAKVRAYNHLLGETATSFFGTPELAARYRSGFPASLDGAPVMLPADGTSFRRSLDHWFDRIDVRPTIVAVADDSALLKLFGEYGAGLFPAATAIEEGICETYGVEVVGRVEEIIERFYVITVEQRIRHPAVMAISDHAKRGLFVD
ncbi:MAG: LysR family transcriptional regulator [Myxococcota bacterium]